MRKLLMEARYRFSTGLSSEAGEGEYLQVVRF